MTTNEARLTNTTDYLRALLHAVDNLDNRLSALVAAVEAQGLVVKTEPEAPAGGGSDDGSNSHNG